MALANCTTIGANGCRSAGALTENLSAEGNFMVSLAAPHVQLDCSTSTAAITTGSCTNGNSDGITNAANVTTTVDVAGCM